MPPAGAMPAPNVEAMAPAPSRFEVLLGLDLATPSQVPVIAVWAPISQSDWLEGAFRLVFG